MTSEEITPLGKESSYGFMTECFFLTQQAMRIGFHAVHDKLIKLNQDLHRVQRLYQEVRGQAASDQEEPVHSIKLQMEKGTSLQNRDKICKHLFS